MLLDGEEHMFHRRDHAGRIHRSRLTGVLPHVDSVASAVLANDWAPKRREVLCSTWR